MASTVHWRFKLRVRNRAAFDRCMGPVLAVLGPGCVAGDGQPYWKTPELWACRASSPAAAGSVADQVFGCLLTANRLAAGWHVSGTLSQDSADGFEGVFASSHGGASARVAGLEWASFELAQGRVRNLEPHIRRMYADIASYGGGFGDGVEAGPYDPFEMVADSGLTPFERAGVAVAVLHRIESAADNTSWQHAQANHGQHVRRLLKARLLDHEPSVRAAAQAFLVSDEAFVTALGDVYEQVVKKWAATECERLPDDADDRGSR